MRTRTRGSLSRGYYTEYIGSIAGPYFPPAPRLTYPREVIRNTRESMTDSITPGYFSKVRNGEVLPVNPMKRSGSFLVSDTCDVEIGLNQTNANGYSHSVYAAIKGSFPVPNPTTLRRFPSVNTVAMLQDAKAKATARGWDIGTTMAEAKKTRQLLSRSADSLGKRTQVIAGVMQRTRRKRPLTYHQALEEFSQRWMELRYGWRPLYYDLLAAQEASQKLIEGQQDRVRYTVTKEESGEVSYTQWRPTNRQSSLEFRWKTEAKFRTRAGVGLSLLLDSPVFIDPLITTYELIPFSFIVDWFFTTGSIIEGFSPFVTSSMDYAFVSKEQELTHTGEVRRSPTSGLPTYDQLFFRPNLDVTAKTVSYDRYLETVSAVPQFRLNLDWMKGLDTAALGTLILGRKIRAMRRVARV